MGQEVYEAEDRGADVALLGARAAVALHLQGIAVAVSAKQGNKLYCSRQLEVVERVKTT
jgi:hypothetical protein